MKNKILLLYTNVRIRNQKPRPPIGLMYLAAALRKKYIPILLDMRIEPNYLCVIKENLSECIFVGISTIIGQQLNFSLEAATLIRGLRPDIPIVFGGTFPSMAPEVVLREQVIDFVSIGDGEDTLIELADALVEGTDLRNVHNIAYRLEKEIVIQQDDFLRSLDTPVMPAWDLVKVENYREINVLSSKGCSAGCNFCYNCIFNHSVFRKRKEDNVIAEIEWLHKERGVNHIAFIDDNFFADLEHAKRLMKAFCNLGWQITWESTCRADDLVKFDEEMLQLIHDAGCQEVFVGFESASDDVLSKMNKNIGHDLINICMENARKYGFKVRALFVIGMVGETKKELFQTLKTVDHLRKKYGDCVKIPVFGIYTPYPHLPPNRLAVGTRYNEPETMKEWSQYHHDKANHQWLKPEERDYLENVIWIYRYYSKRFKFTKYNWKDKLLYFDAYLRWKIKFFSYAPEWKAVRKKEDARYQDMLETIGKEYRCALEEECHEKKSSRL